MRFYTIIACAAVAIIAGGGSAYATSQITTSQIKNGTIRSVDIKDGSVGLRDLSRAARHGGPVVMKRSEVAAAVEDVVTDPEYGLTIRVRGEQGPAGVPGPAGPVGPQGVPAPTTSYTLTITVPAGETRGAFASCPAGKTVVGGGATFAAGDADTVIRSSGPISDPNGWSARVTNNGAAEQPLTVTALCQ